MPQAADPGGRPLFGNMYTHTSVILVLAGAVIISVFVFIDS